MELHCLAMCIYELVHIIYMYMYMYVERFAIHIHILVDVHNRHNSSLFIDKNTLIL